MGINSKRRSLSMRERKRIIVEMGRALLIIGLITSLQMACSSLKETRLEQDEMNAVEAVNVEELDQASRVVITTTSPATYSVYRPLQPVRIMVDISEAVMKEDMPPQLEVNNGTINEIKLSRISGEGNSIARVEIGLEDITGYEVTKQDNQLIVKVEKPAGAKALAVQDKSPLEETPSLELEEGDILLTGGPAEFEEWIEEEEPLPAPAAESKPDELSSPLATPKAKAKKLLDIGVVEKADQTVVNIITDGEVGDFNAFTLEKPKRIVLDLWSLQKLYPQNQLTVNSQGISRIRLGKHPNKLRMVFDVSANQFPSFNFEKGMDRLVMTVSSMISVAPVKTVSPAPVMTAEAGPEEWEALVPGEPAPLVEVVPVEPAPPMVEPAPVEIPVGVPVEIKPSAGARIEAIDFKYTTSASSIVIKSDKPVKYLHRENPDDKIVSILIQDAFLPMDLEKSYDTTEFQSPVNLISSFQSSTEPPEVNITISLNTMAQSTLDQKGNVLTISFENVPGGLGLVPGEVIAPLVGEELVPPAAPAGAPPPAVTKVKTLAGVQEYHGAPIYLDAKGMDVLDALRLIAEVSGYNIIAADDVKGTLTMKLDNVPWDQALDLILQTKDLGKVESGNIYRIAPAKVIREEQQRILADRKAFEELKPIQVKVIPVNYAKATEVQRSVKRILSERKEASVDIDRRSNSLVIRDIPEKIEEAQALVAAIDRITPQVLIEARIVEASTGLARDLAMMWGINYNAGPAWGNPTGVNFPNTIQYNQAVLGGGASATSASTVAAQAAQGLASGISFGSLTGAFNLDLMLKTYETQNRVKIISSPRILTMQDEKATIQQGVTIPYPPAMTTAGAAGQWQFIEAALRLEVTPHVSADKSIVMDIKVSNNEPNMKVVSGGSPSIDKKEAQTSILLKDGETAVIGGIYKIKESETKNQVPFLGEVPILGLLFKDRFRETTKNELLVFITPRIIETGQQVSGL
jgi:type IV pilus assembly protein PilQ